MRLPTPCTALKRDGSPCRFAARKATGLCINHDPSYREQQYENSRRGGRKTFAGRHVIPIPLDQVDLTNRASVQAVLDAVVRMEILGVLPAARSRNLIRGLSIANRNLATGPFGKGHFEYYWKVRQELDALIRNLPRPEATDD